MTTAARDRLARTLRGDAQTAFSVELTARTDDLSLEVEGFGPVKFPVTPAKARKLLGLGQPARFGRGEETLTDPDVRDTWEIPKHLVRAGWDSATLKDVLATVKEELGLPNGAELTADLHSLLVYEPNQFFLAHQDSEKDDSMVGTLVVTLPSSYTGGELMVGHNEEWTAYRGSRTALSLVAFYADCRHEVLRVRSGYRITLTYNLLLHGDTSRPGGDDGTAAELAGLLREHFSTPVPRYYDGPVTDPLRAADAIADAQTAAMLLRPFHIEDLDHESVDSFGKIAGRYGQPWTAELVRTWFGGNQPAWAYGGGQERPRWVADRLPGLCARLHAAGTAGAAAAQRLVDLAWEWTAKEIGTGLVSSSPSRRDEKLGGLGRPLASVLTAAAAIGAASTRDIAAGYVREQGDAVTALEMPALHAAAELSRDGARGEAGFGDLAADCAARLRARLARPQRASGDWSIELPAGGCTCELCGALRMFLEDKSRRTFEWPLAKQRRQHVHSRIDAAELPVTHVTRRQGRPYTLVLNKTGTLFTREQDARTRDETDLEWLAAQWNPGA